MQAFWPPGPDEREDLAYRCAYMPGVLSLMGLFFSHTRDVFPYPALPASTLAALSDDEELEPGRDATKYFRHHHIRCTSSASKGYATQHHDMIDLLLLLDSSRTIGEKTYSVR
jgi:hypothetical protein